MFIKFIQNLMLTALLLLLPFSTNTVAADKDMEPTSTMQVIEKLNINKASAEELSLIKGIGPKKAQSIIDYRKVNGDFIDLKGIIKVKGIGQSTLNKIEPYLSL